MPSAASNYSPAWPGPALLVPITVDALLVGTPNQSSGSLWAQTGIAYGNLATLGAGTIPFQKKQPPPVGAHLLWTLPYGIRHGTQTAQSSAVNFPATPNRWAILRSYVPRDPSQGSASDPTTWVPLNVVPVLTAGVLVSDALGTQFGPNTSSYPTPQGTQPVSAIGNYVTLQQWDGSAPVPPFLQAAGPGDVSWSAAYDNVAGVFAYYDDLTNQAAGFYSYQVLGWYSAPSADPLSAWQTSADWDNLMQQLGWGVGQDASQPLPDSLVAAAQASWAAWQQAHGLSDTTFTAANIDPSSVPGPFGKLMSSWGAYYAANGTSGVPAPQLSLPAQTLCHGSVLRVPWQGPGTGYPSGAPSSGIQGPTVAVGNTPGEAVAAWMANWIASQSPGSNVNEIELALEAFQKGLIFDLGKQPVETAAQLQQAQFASQAGGDNWRVVRPEQDSSASEGDQKGLLTGGGANPTVPLDPTQTQALTTLNAAQAALDAANARVTALTWELWALYYKRWYCDALGDPQYISQVTAAITTLVGAAALDDGGPIAGLLGAARTAVQTGQTAVTDAQNALNTALAADPATKDFVVRQVNNLAFTQPNDPVVLVAGMQADNKFSPPGSYGSDDFLFTRFTGQTLTAVTVGLGPAPANPVTLGFGDLQAAALPGASLASLGVPKELPDLWAEMLLVDPSCSAWLAQLYLNKYRTTYGSASPLTLSQATTVILAQQSTLLNDLTQLGIGAGSLADAAQFTGTPPNVIAFEDGLSQPWSPLFLDWQVTWYPSAVGPDGFPANWQLSGLDYQWTPASMSPPPLVFTGRSTINPQISQTIAQQLESFVGSDPGFEALPDYIQIDLTAIKVQIQQFDLVTQALAGFTQQLVTRQPAPNLQVPASYFPGSVDPSVQTAVDQGQAEQPLPLDANGNPPPYFPLRAGHFQLTGLWVVDAFGQVLDAKGAAAAVNVFPASTVQPPGTAYPNFIQLPPRITQPARLNFNLIDADDDSQPTNSADATSPICGWVMPNHLDDSLMVFDAAGNNLGSVIAISKDENQTGVRWDAAPGSDQPLGSPPNLPNAHLQGFISSLLLAGATGTAAFRNLLDTIDASYWKVVGYGQVAPGNLSVIVGRPMAVVRSQLDIDLLGDPILQFDQDINQTGNFYPPAQAPAFTTAPFQVRVGDETFATNGVTGYFVGDDYGTFYSVTSAPTATSALRRAFATAGDPRPALRQLAGGAPAPATGGYVVPQQSLALAPKRASGSQVVDASVYLTLLVDPTGRIPVISGAFPVQYGDLPPGPVQSALTNMSLSFRVGPVLLDPKQVRMPLPAEIQGKWQWMERESVTSWAPGQVPKPDSTVPQLDPTPPRLREGWLVLDEFNS